MYKSILMMMAMSSVVFSSPVTKRGTFVVGYNSEQNVPITKSIQVSINNEGTSEMKIDDEELLVAQSDGSKVSSYVAKPKKYFFYSLELNPKKQLTGDKNLIVKGSDSSNSSDSSVSDLVSGVFYCNEGATALLTAYVGDGSKKLSVLL